MHVEPKLATDDGVERKQKASESVERKQKVVFVFAASSGAALYVMAPGNKLHDSSQRRTRIITFNKELHVCLRVFMGFPGVLPRHSRQEHGADNVEHEDRDIGQAR